jgi:hypothetical protein
MEPTDDPLKEVAPAHLPTLEGLKTAGKAAGSFVFGDTPSEWAFNAATGPVGKTARLALLGLSAATQSPESEAVLTRLGIKEIPQRLQKMYEMAKQLRERGLGGDVWGKTEGQLTVGPTGAIEAIHSPLDINLSKLKDKGYANFEEIVTNPTMFAENPELKQLVVNASDMPARKMGGFRPPQFPGDKPRILLNERYLDNLEATGSALGHETTHGFGWLNKIPYGMNSKYNQYMIDKLMGPLSKRVGLEDNPNSRSTLLLKKLSEPFAARDLYARDISEVQARGGQSAWPRSRVEPYTHPDVGQPFQFESGARVPAPPNSAYERIMDPNSVVFKNDINRIIEALKSQGGARK